MAAMRIDILTLFPEMFAGVLGSSILKRAAEPVASAADPEQVRPAVVQYELTDIRPFSASRHGKVDQPPYGGGPGLVMQCQPVWDAVQAVEARDPKLRARRLLMTPQGRPLDQPLAEQLAREPRLLIIAGHYEGIDERVVERLRDEGGLDEVSIGDYVLSGGELPAMVLIDTVVRLIPGVLGDSASAEHDSFSPGAGRLLDHPHYTRPATWEGRAVPDVLLSGDHAAVDRWRREQAVKRTQARRPDLLNAGARAASEPVATAVLRQETVEDIAAVDELLRQAFPQDLEARLARRLRESGDAVVSVVAQVAGEVVGQVMLSPMTLVDQPSVRGYLALGPIAVRPDWQKRGIGSALVHEAVRQGRQAAAMAIFLFGDPAWYTRFGFKSAAEAGFGSAYGNGPAFMWLPLRTRLPEHQRGELAFAPVFGEILPPPGPGR